MRTKYGSEKQGFEPDRLYPGKIGKMLGGSKLTRKRKGGG